MESAEGPQSEWGPNFEGHLFFHTASSPIRERLWLLWFLKGTQCLSSTFVQGTD